MKMYLLRSLCVLLIFFLITQTGCCMTSYRNVFIENDSKQDNNKSFAIENRTIQSYSELIKEVDRSNGLNSISETKHKMKNPKTAFWLGFGPGFFVHGLGHAYIGKYWTAGGLFMIEALSIAAFAMGAAAGIAESENNGNSDKANETFGLAFALLFLGSWSYDFIGAPKKAKKMNSEHCYLIYPGIKNKSVTVNFAVAW